jgi:hypothetical protein
VISFCLKWGVEVGGSLVVSKRGCQEVGFRHSLLVVPLSGGQWVIVHAGRGPNVIHPWSSERLW